MKSFPRNSAASLRRAFTLIELLVVIAIIALLAALIFPAVQSAKVRANQTKCSHRLSQWAFAIASFAVDHDGMVLCGSDWNTVRGGIIGVDTKFYELYLNPGGEKTFTWPGTSKAIQGTEYFRACPAQSWSGSSSPTGYGFVRPRELNASGTGTSGIKTTLDGSGATTMLAYNIRQAAKPSQLLQLIETAGSTPTTSKSLTKAAEFDSYVKPICLDSKFQRHGPQVNALFGDGHVESLNWEDIDGDTDIEKKKLDDWFMLN